MTHHTAPRTGITPVHIERDARPALLKSVWLRIAGSSRRAVPVHWSSLLGVVSLSCFAVLTVTGVILLFFYEPSSETVRYGGSYPLLQGVPVSRAYASTLHLSLEVRGGLLVRQVHHWAALVLPASLVLQMLSTFFTGGFRRPRHWSWGLLALTFVLALAAGWSGYGLPDDPLAGTGLRIVEGIVIGVPVIGSWASFVAFGGEFPGHVIERMYWLHVAVVPALLVIVLLLRLRLALRRQPAQFPARGRAESNVVGLPLKPVAVRAFGLFLITTGVLVALGGLVTVSPIWIYGPSSTGHASAGSQPDWYTSFLDGALRLVPPAGNRRPRRHHPRGSAGRARSGRNISHVVSRLAVPRGPGHGRPRRPPPAGPAPGASQPHRASASPAWSSSRHSGLAGATDLVATQLQLRLRAPGCGAPSLLFVGPLVAFYLTRQLCLALSAQERERLLHGTETGRIMRSPDGGYSEIHAPLGDDRARPSRTTKAGEPDGPDQLPRVRAARRGRVARRPRGHRRADRARQVRCVGGHCFFMPVATWWWPGRRSQVRDDARLRPLSRRRCASRPR